MSAEKFIKEPKQINLIEGTFTPSEASDLVNEMIDVKLNFHKLHRLSITEGNRREACEDDSSRIDELTAVKESYRDLIKEAKANGKKLVIKSVIEIIAVED